MMRMFPNKLIIALIFLLVLAARASAQHRIGYINSDEVIPAMPEFKLVQAQLDSMRQASQMVLQAMQAQYDKLEKELEYRSDSNISDSVEDVKLKKLQSLQDAIKDLESKANDDLEKAQDEKMGDIKDAYLQAVSAVARTKGYAYILDKASDAVVFAADKKDDISEAVYKKLGVIPPSMTTDTTVQIIPAPAR
jgi:outer membrane protein